MAEAAWEHPRILLVDTRAERRVIMRTVVETGEQAGVVVAQTATIQGAFAAIDRYGVDAAVVEIQMPTVAHGVALIAALRARSSSLVIVVCSFQANLATQRLALDAGANTYLAKPFSPRDLHQACRAGLPMAAVASGRSEAERLAAPTSRPGDCAAGIEPHYSVVGTE